MLNNHKGITLVELLAAITIVGFLSILIWRVFFQTIDYNSYAITEQTLQQEANVILATLQSRHTKNTIEVLSDNNGDMLEATVLNKEDTDPSNKIEISNRPNIEYFLFDSYPDDPAAATAAYVGPKSIASTINSNNGRREMPVHLVLKATYKDDEPIYFVLSTTLSKLTTQ